jgi:hypothetical protein
MLDIAKALREAAFVGLRILAKSCHWRFGKSSNDVWIAKDAIFQRCKAKLLVFIFLPTGFLSHHASNHSIYFLWQGWVVWMKFLVKFKARVRTLRAS